MKLEIETMTPTQIIIRLGEIASEATDYVDEAEHCESTDMGQIVERMHGKVVIVDGIHRTAGQLAYCRENGLDPREHKISVILACENDSDNDLASAAAEPGPGQAAAIAEIYRLADYQD